MRIIDISRELLTAPLYPGDPSPRLEPISEMALLDDCNLSALHACLHTGTHIDAPRHFVPDGEDAASMPLEACIGECEVVAAEGALLGAEVEALQRRLPPQPRILFRGDVTLTPSAAFVLADAGVRLIGVEGPSVAAPDCTAAVHRQLLGAGMFLLEGLDLSQAQEDRYFLCAAPLKIAGADGTPVRAVLFERRR